MNGRKKVTVVGAGNVGATCALEVARRDYADVVLVDIVPNFAAGKALDMNQMASVTGYEPAITGSERYDETEGSDVVVITAGRPRSPGMSRDDLVTTNEAIVAAVTKEVVRRSPKASSSWSRIPWTRCATSRRRSRAFRRSASSAWPGSSTRRASRRSSPGRPARRCRTSRRWCSAATATRWSPSSPRRRSAASARAAGDQGEDPKMSSAPARAAARSSGCSARRPGTRRRGGCADGRGDLPRPEARAPVHGAARGRVRRRRALLGRPGRARPGRSRAIVRLKLRRAEKKMLRESAAAVREVVGVLTTTG